MKKRLLFIFWLCILPMIAWCADGDLFTANTIEGINMTFKVISETEKTCEVRADGYGNPAIDYYTMGTITIPEEVEGYKVTRIGNYAFEYCFFLENIVIPHTIVSIESWAFYRVDRLIKITIPSSVKSIDDRAFFMCENLSRITFESMFGTNYDFSQSFYSCNNLRIIECIPSNATDILDNTFDDEVYSLATLYVPLGAKDSYQSCNGWSKFNNIKEIDPDKGVIIFDNLEVKEVCLQNWDTDMDGELSKTEAAAVTEIGSAFADMSSERDYNFNEFQYFTGVEYIPEHAFQGPLVSIVIPKNVLAINSEAFSYCDRGSGYSYEGSGSLTHITVDEENSYYDSREGCNAIISKDTITARVQIDENSWYSYFDVDNVPANTLIIGCKKSKIPSSVTSIGRNAFYGQGLKSIEIPNSVKIIGEFAFRETDLTNLILPNALVSIDRYAFEHITTLESIFVPRSLKQIGENVFSYCNNLKSIVVEGGNMVYDSRDNCNSIIETATNTLIQGCMNSTIPGTVTAIGSCAFAGQDSLKHLIIPSSVADIKQDAFRECTCLETIDVDLENAIYDSRNNCNAIIHTATNTLIQGSLNSTIPSTITDIGNYAFYQMWNLKSISIPNSVKSIGYMSFYRTRLKTILIPSSVTSIGSCAFGDSFVTTVVMMTDKPFEAGDEAFYNNDSRADKRTLIVQPGMAETYKSLNSWKDFTYIIENRSISFSDSKVKELCISNWDANNDGEIDLGEAAIVDDIGDVFAGKSQIESFDEFVYFSAVDSLQENAFKGTTALRSIVIPRWVEYIAPKTFMDCVALERLSVEENNYDYNSPANSNAIIGDGRTLVVGCKNTIIPENINRIGEYAFYGRIGLENINLPITDIKDYAFYGCSDIKNITVSRTYPSRIAENVFSDTTYNTALLYVPVGCVDVYRNTAGWSIFKNISEIVSPSNPEPYAVLSQDSLTVTFYYDTKKTERGGFDINDTIINDENGDVISPYGTATTAVFDASFADYRPTSTAYWFISCHSLTSIKGIENLKTDNVTLMHAMFAGCEVLNNLDVSGFKTDNVVNMDWMFMSCASLTSLDLSSFNTAKVTNMSSMFGYCYDLKTIYASSDWSTAAVTSGDAMFTGCTSLVGGAGTIYDENHVDYTYAHIDGGPDNPGYLTKSLSMGDANGDGDVNIADAVVTVTSILGQPIEGNFYKYAADMNNDSEIDIFDVSMIVSNVLGAKTPAPALTRGNIDHVPAEAIRLTADANHIYMDIDQAQQYTAFQFDMSLPEGMSLDGVKLVSGITDHQVSFVQRDENEYRVVGLSLSNEVLRSADGHLIQLQISNTASEDHVKVSNMLFVTPAGKTVTGIDEHLNTTMTTDGNIYNLKGEKLGKSRQQLGKGIYIMNHKKVIIK